MPETITVNETNEDEFGFVFEIFVGDLTYKVTLAKDYWQKLTNGTIKPEELVKKSFEFLLEREPASSILPEFDLPLIGHYFPEYEQEIQRKF